MKTKIKNSIAPDSRRILAASIIRVNTEQKKGNSWSTFRFFLIIIWFYSTQAELNAQNYTNLKQLKGHHVQVYHSEMTDTKATQMAMQIDEVIRFYDPILNFRPSVTLLILSPADWSKYTSFPVYGMPHYSDNKTLIVASEDNNFWKSFIPPADQIPAEFAELIKKTYSSEKNQLTMEPFFDLLAIHELGHAYHKQDSLEMQRKWMGELFCNLFLHTYIAEKEPLLLPALTTFPKMVVSSTASSSLKFTSLPELETHYTEIGQRYPQNYGWYQCRWHMAACTIYDLAGISAVKNLWFTLKTESAILDDTNFVNLLKVKVHQSVADVQLKWNQF